MFTYQAYGQTIGASFPIPEFIEGGVHDKPDITIYEGETPESLEDALGEGVLYQARSNQFLLKLDHIAHFLVQNGNEIVVRRTPGSLDSDVRLFLLGSCLGALLHQQGMLTLHASAMQVGDGAVLFAGQSDSGKSTLLGAFLRRGYKMMADDITGIMTDGNGRVVALPAISRIQLWADAVKALKHDPAQLVQVRPDLQKFQLDTRDRFVSSALPISRIYTILHNNKDEFSLEPMPKIARFRTVLYSTYHQQFLDGLDMRAPHFVLTHATANQAEVIRVIRPRAPYRLKKLADLIEADFRQGDRA
jgi:hypothetical protein